MLYVYVVDPSTGREAEIEIRTEEGLRREVTDLCARATDLRRTAADSETVENTRKKEHDLAELCANLAGIIMVVLDDQGRVTRINEKGLEVLGYEREEILGRDWLEHCLPGTERDRAGDFFRRVMAGELGAGEYFENSIATRDGRPRLIAFRNAILREGPRVEGILLSGADVTEQRQMEEALKESENRLRTVLENSLDAPYRRNLQADRYDYMSPAVKRLTGFSAKAMSAMSARRLLERIHPEDRSTVVKQLRRARSKGKALLEYRFRDKSGRYRWLSDTITILPDKDGKPFYLVGIVRDVTAYKEAQGELLRHRDQLERLVEERTRQLWESERRYRDLVDNALVGVYQTKLNGDIVYANDTASRILGFETQEEATLYRSSTSYRNPQDRKTVLEMLRREGKVVNHEVELVTKTGDPVVVLLSATLKSGLITGMMMDITKRKQAEKNLAESEDRYRTAIECSNDGVTLVRGGEHIYVNRKFLEIFGFDDPGSVLGKSHALTVHPDDLAMVLEYNRKRQSGEPVPSRYEFRGIRKDGTTIYVEVSGTGTTYGGTPVTLAYVREITERKQAEEELKRHREHLEELVGERTSALQKTNEQLQQKITELSRAEKKILALNQELEDHNRELRALNEELKAFSYSLSHDLKTPLIAIAAFSRKLLEGYEKNMDERGRKYLKIVRDNGLHMEELINDLLTFLSAGNKTLHRTRIKMDIFVREVLDQIAAAHQSRTIRLTLGGLPDLEGDRTMMRQVLSNLLGNAVKYSAPRHVIAIEVAGWSEQKRNVYYVRDNGIGFPLEQAEKLFEVFQRLHTSAEFEGTGLGLAIVKHVIHRHGGEVWAEGKVGEGATFYFSVPRRNLAGDKHVDPTSTTASLC